jgi:glycosyltransferase involved in cell wall biosynthesis
VDPKTGGPIEGILQQNAALGSMYASRREIVSLDPPDAPFLAGFPIKVYPLGMGSYSARRPSRFRRFGFTPRLAPWLRSHVAEYDAVIVNGLWNYASVGAAMTLPEMKTPYYVFPHGMMDPWFRRRYPFKHLVKQVFWLFFEGRLLRGARRVFFTSEDEMRLAEGEFRGHPYVGEVVGYGTNDAPADCASQQAAFRAAVPGLEGRPYLLFLSRIHPKKGSDLLIRSFARIATRHLDTDLVMAGPDQLGCVGSLMRQARALGVEGRVHWPGMLRADAKWGAFRGAEAFILPSHQENFGIVVAEALACATPVLITDKVNIWREVEADSAGLVAPDTQAGVDALLERYFALDPAARVRMRAAARGCFEAHFDMGVSAKHMLAAIMASM